MTRCIDIIAKQQEAYTMKETMKNRLLAVMDGSERSIQTAQYLAEISSFRNHEIHLFHVFNKVPESYYDLEREPASLNPAGSVRAWEAQERARIKAHLSQCRQILLSADFHPDRVKTTIHHRREGIARDIIAEAHKGYDAIVLRRRGMGRLHGLVMGSVAFKLLSRVSHIPLMFAGRKPFNRRILLAVDGSAQAMHAVSFMGEKLRGSDCRLRLVNILRGDLALKETAPRKMEVREIFEGAEERMLQLMQKAEKHLIAAGIAPDAISIDIIKGMPSRAGAIVTAAETGEYNTVVLGRKGVSRVREFAVGRVGSKVLQIGRELGVWMVP